MKSHHRHKQPQMGVQNQEAKWPWALVWKVILAALWVTPVWLVWLSLKHWRVLLGPRNYSESYLALAFGVALLGTGVWALVLGGKARVRAKGVDRSDRKIWRKRAAILESCGVFLLYTALVIGLASLFMIIPYHHRSVSWDSWNGNTFEPFKWYIAIGLLLLCALGMRFEKSKNPVAKFLFGTPVPWLDRLIERLPRRGW